ncbi:hypothetical protein ACPYO6_15470 [Georgenia sp. Z1344]|uniref:hypothetical protein n=1 Tax=Georgenia sp. Z1344 TaxID=3416706 RepID=UPI003CF378D2
MTPRRRTTPPTTTNPAPGVHEPQSRRRRTAISTTNRNLDGYEPQSRRKGRGGVALVGLAMVLAACGGGSDDDGAGDGPAPGTTAAEAGSALDLAEVCPATVVMQQDWQPQAEHGAMYELVGEDHEIDTEAKSVTGSLVAGDVDTGVQIEVRPGGPNVGFQSVAALMYLDDDITVGAVNTDSAIVNHEAQPTVAVVSQLTVSPQILMWDPETYPEAETVEDIVATDATVVTSGPVLPALVASTTEFDLSRSDTSYEGTPARFVSDPSIVQQGLLTNEPYVYENEVEPWGRPVASGLLAEVGHSTYPGPVAVRADRVEELAPCLERLVPVLQQSQIDFLADPGPATDLILDLVESYQLSWTYSEGVAQYSVETQLAEDLVHDDPASGTFGAFDPERMQEIVDTYLPVLVDQGAVSFDTLDPAQLYTNEYLDDSISMADQS